ncbi:hypothetical protein D3C71_1911740 [compost metagenome]
MGDLEDRRARVLVDRYNHIRALHAYRVLNRTSYSDGKIQLGPHRMPRLSDLMLMADPARIYRCPGCTYFAA